MWIEADSDDFPLAESSSEIFHIKVRRVLRARSCSESELMDETHGARTINKWLD